MFMRLAPAHQPSTPWGNVLADPSSTHARQPARTALHLINPDRQTFGLAHLARDEMQCEPGFFLPSHSRQRVLIGVFSDLVSIRRMTL